MRYFIKWAPIVSIVTGLVLVAGSSLAQDTAPLHSQSSSQRDMKQLERVAMRVVRADLSHRGVTDWNNVGFDPDVDAHLKSTPTRRDSLYAQELVTELGGKRISTGSVRPNSSNCEVGTLTKIVYLNPPVIRGDNAAIQVTYAFKAMRRACRFYSESKTFAFVRRQGDWIYVGVKGKIIST